MQKLIFLGGIFLNHKQTEHLENYNESVFFPLLFAFSCAVRAHPGGFIFFISPTANHKLPYTRPPLACQSPPWGDRLERDKRGREQTKAREDETGGGGTDLRVVKKKKQTQG